MLVNDNWFHFFFVLVSSNKKIAFVEQGNRWLYLERNYRKGVGTWPIAHAHSASALKKIYIQLTVNDLINTRSDPGRLLTLWV